MHIHRFPPSSANQSCVSTFVSLFAWNRFVYKLTDFGSAKEFDDNEMFMSMYGTEEYLVSALDLS